jgi:chromosome segregation protein
MRLNKIKLSGFKSFLEPTTLAFSSSLTGVVGPNGCGKSNVVDAIRWVIGESSAKQLRGESLSDVIFAGSATRKPVGKTQVELRFDNAEQKLGGRFAHYHEISIKREMTREGGSSYFLNHSPCRRRDIIEILLGTGLGPRSYAVIEQGMISQLISATPEELRAYLEEAAMVSKYKEKRKEAENSMSKTRGNLNRINDLSLEVNERLEGVKGQVEAARSYRKWSQELKKASAQLELFSLFELKKKQKTLQENIEKKEKDLEDILLKEKKNISEHEMIYQDHAKQSALLSQTQDHHYRVQAELSRLEQSIQDKSQQALEFEKQLNSLENHQETLTIQLTEDQKQFKELEAQIAKKKPIIHLKREEGLSQQKALLEAQSIWQSWQKKWDVHHQSILHTRESLKMSQQQVAYLEKHKKEWAQRLSDLLEEKEKLDVECSEHNIKAQENEIHELSKQIEAEGIKLKSKDKHLQLAEQSKNQARAHLNKQQEKLQTLKAELHSLKTLQENRFKEDNRHAKNWIKAQGQSNVVYLAEMLQVEQGWEKAFETVLKDALKAFCFNDIESLIKGEKWAANLYLLEQSCSPTSTLSHAAEKNQLIAKLKVLNPLLENLLAGVYIAERLSEAFKKRPKLKVHESIVTQEGIWMGKYWLKTPNTVKEVQGRDSSILLTQKKIETLSSSIQNAQTQANQSQKDLDQAEKIAAELKREIELIKNQENCLKAKQNKKQAHLSAKSTYLEKSQIRLERATNEIQTLKEQIREQEETQVTALKALKALEMTQKEQEQKEKELNSEKNRLEQRFEKEKKEAEQAENQLKIAENDLNIMQEKMHYLEKQILRKQEKIQGFREKKEWLERQYQTLKIELPKLEAEQSIYLNREKETQSKITQFKQVQQKLEDQLKQLKTALEGKREKTDVLRKTLESLRIEHEASSVQAQYHLNQLQSFGFKEKDFNDLPAEANRSSCLQQKNQLKRQIESLGEVNLAADKEYEALNKRKLYLEAQMQDLKEALETLETAIGKIDQETCQQLEETFKTVNQNFMLLFSKIFEGGQASLERTQNDWLTTGIIVKAQPKGKRNSTIQMLSGGEKALTAIALVFAFFQLNPAPFCVLDEVDAPLDDTNIGRFCRLVEEMSSQLQFIFISHSKVTLSLAKQLIGVTMREPGVSKVVSVNMEEAIQMAEELE